MFLYLLTWQKAKQDGAIGNSGKELVAEAERLDVKDKAVLAMAELLFDCKMLQQIPKYRVHFLRVSVTLISNK